MRKTTMFITPVIAAGMVLGVSNLSPKAESVTTMEDGDTLWSIAAEHEEVSVDDLLNINHSLDPYSIPTGTEILLERVSDDASSETVTHTVQPGNTLWSIANAYDGVNIEQLIERNQGLDPYALPVGAELTIVENNNSGSTSEENITHTVQPGNTLWNIASVYDGVSVQDLLDANPEVDEHSIPVGSTIYIPIS